MTQNFAQTTIYQLFPRAFTREGTLAAASAHLADIASLGVDYVYLCPVFLSDDGMDKTYWSERQIASGFENPKNPYRMKDYFAVDPEYGTKEDLINFVKRAHELGLKVLFDLVYYHCGPNAVFLKEHPDFIQRTPDGSPFTGEWAFPRLNFENKALREYLYDNMLYWIKTCDVDGYRCDVGSLCPMDFWKEGIRRCRELKKDFFMVDECPPDGDEHTGFDAFYNFDWSTDTQAILRGKKNADALPARYQSDIDGAPYHPLLLRALDNHDYANDCMETRYEVDPGTHGVNAALVLDALMDGVFFLYGGTEACDVHRNSIFYSREHSAGRDCTVTWDTYLTDNAVRRRALFCALISLRKSEPALAGKDTAFVHVGEKTLVFTRGAGEGKLTIGVNLSDKEETVPVTLAGKPVLLMRNAAFGEETKLGSYGYFVCKD